MPNSEPYKLTRWTLRFLKKLAGCLSSEVTVPTFQNAKEAKKRIGMPMEVFLEMNIQFHEFLVDHLPRAQALEFRRLFLAGFVCGWKEAATAEKEKSKRP